MLGQDAGILCLDRNTFILVEAIVFKPHILIQPLHSNTLRKGFQMRKQKQPMDGKKVTDLLTGRCVTL